jgi:hypothetical protein
MTGVLPLLPREMRGASRSAQHLCKANYADIARRTRQHCQGSGLDELQTRTSGNMVIDCVCVRCSFGEADRAETLSTLQLLLITLVLHGLVGARFISMKTAWIARVRESRY